MVYGGVDGWDGLVSARPLGCGSVLVASDLLSSLSISTQAAKTSQWLIKTFLWNPCEVVDTPPAASRIPLHTADNTHTLRLNVRMYSIDTPYTVHANIESHTHFHFLTDSCAMRN